MKNKKTTSQNPTITVNRKARYDYHLRDRYEAGIVLQGTEVKAIRNGQFNLTDSYAQVSDGEVFLIDAYIGLYDQGNRMNHEPKRPRKLLLHRSEIKKLERSVQSKGMTLVPTRAYFTGGKVKLELAVAEGKRLYDKRDKIDREQANREIRSYS
ncbi:SsrA-binding protein SmpB [Candidatus Poribacteria bacterium]|nr:SsrA-binding protein SmpB [Candidatus Poribacteria bacterium]